LKRGGDVSIFYQYEPESLMLAREKELEHEEARGEMRQTIREITRRLTRRQIKVLVLRARGLTFDEITNHLGCSRRTILYDWEKIRQVTHEVLNGD
jgi:DNA-binding NarL/FixJ family response regulator